MSRTSQSLSPKDPDSEQWKVSLSVDFAGLPSHGKTFDEPLNPLGTRRFREAKPTGHSLSFHSP